MGEILYPYALNSAGEVIHIRSFTRGESVRCIGCEAPMIGKLGEIVAKHFAHASDGPCHGESWLHRTAKLLIAHGYRAARSENRPYYFTWTCSGCRLERREDVTRWSTEVQTEASVASGTRSDLVFAGGRRAFVVEVVVAHPPEQSAIDAYKAADVAMFLFSPNPETLGELHWGITASAVITAKSRCYGCIALRRRQEEEAREERRCQEAERREREEVGTYIQSALKAAQARHRTRGVAEWSVDRNGEPLRTNTQRMLTWAGARLIEAGFRQSQTRPWLYSMRLGGFGTVIADLGGTKATPVWRDPRPRVYVSRFRGTTAVYEEVVEAVARHLRQFDVKLRR